MKKKWYSNYLTVYGKHPDEIPAKTYGEIRQALASRQSAAPIVSVVVIAYNEERRLTACLWSLSQLTTSMPIEIVGVNNNSSDETEKVFRRLGLPYFNEQRQSPGYARQCGLDHARGKYHFCIDADTIYPPAYVDLMMAKLQRPGVVCVSSLWSFYPDEHHGALALWIFETIRDIFLWAQHFKRPELCVRGMVMAFKTEPARNEGIRTDIRRGEDGSLALALKKHGRITFLYNRSARPVTGYGTLGSQSLWQSFLYRLKVQAPALLGLFRKKEHYEDTADNLIG